MLATFLGMAGHRVVTASDGPQALDVLRTLSPDVAVLDIGLPVMDGYELARRTRDFLGPRTPLLIAVTGYGQVEDAERSREAGFSHRGRRRPADAARLYRSALLTRPPRGDGPRRDAGFDISASTGR